VASSTGASTTPSSRWSRAFEGARYRIAIRTGLGIRDRRFHDTLDRPDPRVLGRVVPDIR
jgi:hypothetical protein